MVVSKKLNSIKAHFKKFSKNNYVNKNNFPKIRTSMGSDPVAGGQSVTYDKCLNLGLITNCTNDGGRIAYCHGSVFRNPLVGYRKVPQKCDIKTEEIYKDPYALSCELGGGYDRRIRFINNKGGKVDKKYSHSYKDYLIKNCKSFDVHENRTDTKVLGTTKFNCSKDASGCTVYKITNKQYGCCGAVSSSSRLSRLKYNLLLTAQRDNHQNGGFAGFYNQPGQYKPIKNNKCSTNLRKKIRIGGVMRWSR